MVCYPCILEIIPVGDTCTVDLELSAAQFQKKKWTFLVPAIFRCGAVLVSKRRVDPERGVGNFDKGDGSDHDGGSGLISRES